MGGSLSLGHAGGTTAGRNTTSSEGRITLTTTHIYTSVRWLALTWLGAVGTCRPNAGSIQARARASDTPPQVVPRHRAAPRHGRADDGVDGPPQRQSAGDVPGQMRADVEPGERDRWGGGERRSTRWSEKAAAGSLGQRRGNRGVPGQVAVTGRRPAANVYVRQQLDGSPSANQPLDPLGQHVCAAAGDGQPGRQPRLIGQDGHCSRNRYGSQTPKLHHQPRRWVQPVG